jgi:hypothetical protein
VQDRPTAAELLAAVRAFLEDEVVPALDGPQRFHARVAVNVLAIVGRELAEEEATLVAEWTRLAALFGRDPGPRPAGLAGLRAAVREATAMLAERIRGGAADEGPFRDAVRAHVRATVREKLGIANPLLVAAAAPAEDGTRGRSE